MVIWIVRSRGAKPLKWEALDLLSTSPMQIDSPKLNSPKYNVI